MRLQAAFARPNFGKWHRRSAKALMPALCGPGRSILPSLRHSSPVVFAGTHDVSMPLQQSLVAQEFLKQVFYLPQQTSWPRPSRCLYPGCVAPSDRLIPCRARDQFQRQHCQQQPVLLAGDGDFLTMRVGKRERAKQRQGERERAQVVRVGSIGCSPGFLRMSVAGHIFSFYIFFAAGSGGILCDPVTIGTRYEKRTKVACRT